MYIVHVHIHVKPELIESFKAVTLENAQNSLQEPGIARFDVLQLAEDPTRFVLVEVYRTPEDPAKHKQTEHYNRWRERAEPMMSETRTRSIYSNAFPSDADW